MAGRAPADPERGHVTVRLDPAMCHGVYAGHRQELVNADSRACSSRSAAGPPRPAAHGRTADQSRELLGRRATGQLQLRRRVRSGPCPPRRASAEVPRSGRPTHRRRPTQLDHVVNSSSVLGHLLRDVDRETRVGTASTIPRPGRSRWSSISSAHRPRDVRNGVDRRRFHVARATRISPPRCTFVAPVLRTSSDRCPGGRASPLRAPDRDRAARTAVVPIVVKIGTVGPTARPTAATARPTGLGRRVRHARSDAGDPGLAGRGEPSSGRGLFDREPEGGATVDRAPDGRHPPPPPLERRSDAERAKATFSLVARTRRRHLRLAEADASPGPKVVGRPVIYLLRHGEAEDADGGRRGAPADREGRAAGAGRGARAAGAGGRDRGLPGVAEGAGAGDGADRLRGARDGRGRGDGGAAGRGVRRARPGRRAR